MLKWILTSLFITLSLLFLKLGFLSFEDASNYLNNYDFNNIFFKENWLTFRNIFLVYALVTVMIAFIVKTYFRNISSYISEK